MMYTNDNPPYLDKSWQYRSSVETDISLTMEKYKVSWHEQVVNELLYLANVGMYVTDKTFDFVKTLKQSDFTDCHPRDVANLIIEISHLV